MTLLININSTQYNSNLTCITSTVPGKTNKNLIVRHYGSSIKEKVIAIKDGVVITKRQYLKMPSDFDLIMTMFEDAWNSFFMFTNKYDTEISVIAAAATIGVLYYVYRNYYKTKRNISNDTNIRTKNKNYSNEEYKKNEHNTDHKSDDYYSSGSDSDHNDLP